MIEEVPLQLYLSALIFAPSSSLVGETYSHELPTWLCRCPAKKSGWDDDLVTLEGHSGAVKKVTFSPDSSLIASESSDGTVRLWNANTGAALGVLEDQVLALAISPDSLIMATALLDSTVKLWNLRTGVACGNLEKSSWDVGSMAFSLDGRFLAGTSVDVSAELWRLKSNTTCLGLGGFSNSGFCVALSPDSVALAITRQRIMLWDVSTGKVVRTLDSDVQFLTTYTDTDDSHLDDSDDSHLYDFIYNSDDSVRAVSPDGQLVAIRSGTMVRLRNRTSGALCGILDGHSRSVCALAFSPDGQLLASGSRDCTIKLWNKTAGASPSGPLDIVTSVVFSPNGRSLTTSLESRTMEFWNTRARVKRQRRLGNEGPVQSIIFSPDSLILACASREYIKLWYETSFRERLFLYPLAPVTCMAFSPNSRLLASGYRDGMIRIWECDLDSDVKYKQFLIRAGQGSSIAFSPNGLHLGIGTSRGSIILWDTRRGVISRTLAGHSADVISLAFSPDGRFMASALSTQTVELWNATDWDRIYTIFDVGSIELLRFSTDSTCLETIAGPIRLAQTTITRPAADASTITACLLGVQGRWITYDDVKLIMLRHETQWDLVATHGNMLVIRLTLEQVVFFEFDFRSQQQWV
jgi:WD40 repeat protein